MNVPNAAGQAGSQRLAILLVGLPAAALLVAGAWALLSMRGASPRESRQRSRAPAGSASPRSSVGGLPVDPRYGSGAPLVTVHTGELLPLAQARLLPDFKLEQAHGGSIRRDDLRGKVWVADAMFTSCSSICLSMSRSMQRLQELLEDVPQVRLVSLTVDPERDSRAGLAEYGRRYGAGRRWLFLRGDREELRKVIVQGFRMGDTSNLLNHSDRFVVVDAEGRVRGWFVGTDEEAMPALAQKVRTLVEEGRRSGAIQ